MDRPRHDSPGRGVRSAFAAAGTMAVVCAAALLAPVALAGSLQPPPDYGFQWSTITHPGNAARALPVPTLGVSSAGRVDYAYRIATTEVTRAQWFEFVLAYAPYATDNEEASPQFIGNGIQWLGSNAQGVPQYALVQGPTWWADPGWRYAARYCNWLHNGKKPAGAATLADFSAGAYDTSTFRFENGVTLDQRVRSPGARYWIPNVDEWVKAAYFDPNRFGPGQPGYWDYPITSNTAPIPGLPSQGGQTNTGFFPAPFDVGQYPGVRSPWGLLDVSGGGREFLENWLGTFGRLFAGSATGEPVSPAISDRYLRSLGNNTPTTSIGYTLRLASAVPSPPTAVVGVALAPLVAGCRRHRHEERQQPRPSAPLRVRPAGVRCARAERGRRGGFAGQGARECGVSSDL